MGVGEVYVRVTCECVTAVAASTCGDALAHVLHCVYGVSVDVCASWGVFQPLCRAVSVFGRLRFRMPSWQETNRVAAALVVMAHGAGPPQVVLTALSCPHAHQRRRLCNSVCRCVCVTVASQTGGFISGSFVLGGSNFPTEFASGTADIATHCYFLCPRHVYILRVLTSAELILELVKQQRFPLAMHLCQQKFRRPQVSDLAVIPVARAYLHLEMTPSVVSVIIHVFVYHGPSACVFFPAGVHGGGRDACQRTVEDGSV